MKTKIKNTWKIIADIGKGTFGQVWSGITIGTGERVAIKMESLKKKTSTLLTEKKIYKRLKADLVKVAGIPSYIWFGYDRGYSILITQLLGHSLEKLF